MNKNWALRRDTKHIIKNWFISIIFTWIIIWLLFFLFNVFSGLLIKEKAINDNVASRIGMYFYIQDENEANWDEVYKRIINIKDELTAKWIKAEFSSKNDAFGFLESKIPEITENFEKFWIENTLPSTLYVMFKNEKEYNIMKDIIVANKDIILNVKDVDIIRNYFKTKPIAKAWIFGSYSRGEERADSDVDILVSLQDGAKMGFAFAGMICDLEDLLNKNVDLVVDGTLLPFAQESVNNDKILIYERANSWQRPTWAYSGSHWQGSWI